VGVEADFQIKIARATLTQTRRALARQTDVLPGAHPFGNLHLQSALARHHMALRIDFGHAKVERSGRAPVGVFQIDEDLRMVILPAQMHALGSRPALARPRAPRAASAARKQGLEKVAEIGLIARHTAALLEARAPVRRRLKVLTGAPVAAELIVGRALFPGL
jgi:hypothetical protein